MTTFTIGQRVNTPHGPGTVAGQERANDEWPGYPPRMVLTGRIIVTLDTWPFASSGKEACYVPKELEPLP